VHDYVRYGLWTWERFRDPTNTIDPVSGEQINPDKMPLPVPAVGKDGSRVLIFVANHADRVEVKKDPQKYVDAAVTNKQLPPPPGEKPAAAPAKPAEAPPALPAPPPAPPAH
jgi:hypothetical protein